MEYRILHLEDSEPDSDFVKRLLEKAGLDFQYFLAEDEESFSRGINEFKPDVILCDHALPQFDSVMAFEKYRESKLEIPFILVTGSVSEEYAVEMIKKGIDDYLLKTNLQRLPQAITSSFAKRENDKKLRESQEEMKRKNVELIKINSELDRFVYSISHELRAPLSSVMGLCSVIKLNHLDKDSRRILELINLSVDKMDDTIREILDYSRNARNEVHTDKIDLRTIIDDALRPIGYIQTSYPIEKRIRINLQEPFYSDNSRVKVIINNLISNSIKYRKKEYPLSFIEVTAVVNNEKLVLEIADNGIGIKSEYLPSLFEMFYRATTAASGAGLGLYIAKECVDKLSGKIEVESEFGEGTKFTIEIPNNIPEKELES